MVAVVARTGRRLSAFALLTACGGVLAGCGGGGPAGRTVASPSAAMTVTVSSPVVTEGGTIPRRFTCDGDDASLPLTFSGLPSGTAGLAMTIEDPDAPDHTFVHWVVWGIDPGRPALGEGQVPPGAVQGRNDFDRQGYGGPCPPHGQNHRYVVTAYALSRPVDLPAGSSAADLRDAVAASTLAWGRLTAHYSR
jgi:Raf kinase inhibitor-like YbhB/YbcL family protein